MLVEIRGAAGLGAALAGALTTAPVLCLGLFGPLAPRLARRSSTEAVVAAFLAVLAAAHRQLSGAAASVGETFE